MCIAVWFGCVVSGIVGGCEGGVCFLVCVEKRVDWLIYCSCSSVG